MTLYDRLRHLYLYGDRIQGREGPGWVKIPLEDAKRLVWEAAKTEGRDGEIMPWENGENYEKRIQTRE